MCHVRLFRISDSIEVSAGRQLVKVHQPWNASGSFWKRLDILRRIVDFMIRSFRSFSKTWNLLYFFLWVSTHGILFFSFKFLANRFPSVVASRSVLNAMRNATKQEFATFVFVRGLMMRKWWNDDNIVSRDCMYMFPFFHSYFNT